MLAFILRRLFQAVIVSFASFLAWFWLLRRYLASPLGVFSFLTPVFGVVLGIWLLPMIVVAPAIAVAEGTTLRASLRRSQQLTRGRRLRTWVLVGIAFGFVLLTSPLIGLVVLLLTAKAFWVMNIVVGVVNAVTLPWLAAVLYLLYADLRLRADARDAADAVAGEARDGVDATGD